MGVACHMVYGIPCPFVEFESRNGSDYFLLIVLFSTESGRKYTVT